MSPYPTARRRLSQRPGESLGRRGQAYLREERHAVGQREERVAHVRAVGRLLQGVDAELEAGHGDARRRAHEARLGDEERLAPHRQQLRRTAEEALRRGLRRLLRRRQAAAPARRRPGRRDERRRPGEHDEHASHC